MEVAIASDLHLEFHVKILKLPRGDVAILAGDLGYPIDSLYRSQLVKLKSKFEAIFVITGNHEYYCGLEMETVDNMIETICNEVGVYFLNHKAINYKGYTFIGCTLWSHISEEQRPHAERYSNDFLKIKDMTFERYNNLHQEDVKWIEEMLATEENVIVVTHFLPTKALVHQKYHNHPLGCCFHTNLERMIKTPVRLWVSGHTHTHMDVEVNGVRCIVNPRGYPREATDYHDKTFRLE